MKQYLARDGNDGPALNVAGLLLCIMVVSCSGKEYPDLKPSDDRSYTYYVATDGNDSNYGTLDAPLRSINTALNKAIPGDTVLVRGGIYHQKIFFPKTGRADKYITLKAYPGEKPVIDGTGLSITGKEALVTIRSVNYIVFEGFDVCNYKSSAPWVNINGILADEGSGNISIRKNRIYNIEHNVRPEDGRSGHGIEILGNTNVAMKNILIEENEIFDCNTGYSENLTINGYVDGFIIRKNKVYNGENIGIVAAGGYAGNKNPALNYARHGVISDNEVFNIDGTTGPIPAYNKHNGAIGIYIDGAINVVAERNHVHDCGRGIGIVSETNNFPTEGCIVRNNFVYNSSLVGIYLGGYEGYTGGGTNDCYVINNSLYYNSRDLGYNDEVEGEIRLTENCNNNVIKNNIIYPRPDRGVFVNKQSTGGTNNMIGNNLYYSTGEKLWRWNNIAYTNFEEWKLPSGDVNSIAGVDPEFISITIPDLHVTSFSPAKNTGVVISADINGNTDIDGNKRIVNNKISKGAHQVQ